MYPLLTIPGAVHGVIFIAFLVVLYSILTLFFVSPDRISHAQRHIKYVYILGFVIGVVCSFIVAPAAGGWGIISVIIYAPAYLGTLIIGLIPIYFISKKRTALPVSPESRLPWFYIFGADLRVLGTTLAIAGAVVALVGIMLAVLPHVSFPNLASVYRDYQSFLIDSQSSQVGLRSSEEIEIMFNEKRPLTTNERIFLSLVGQENIMTASEMMNPVTSIQDATSWREFVYDTKYCAEQRILFIYPGCIYITSENELLLIDAPLHYLELEI